MAAVVPLALGAYQIIKNVSDGNKAKKAQAAAEANKPVRRTSQADVDNAALADSELAQGMSAKSSKAYNDAADRGVATSISELLKSGGDSNTIGEIYDSTEKGRQNLAIMQDQLRLAQIQNVLKTNETIAEEDSTNWLTNEYGPYINKLSAASKARQAAAEGVNQGINTTGSGIMGLIGPKNLPTTNNNTPTDSLGVTGTNAGSAGANQSNSFINPQTINIQNRTPLASNNFAFSNFLPQSKAQVGPRQDNGNNFWGDYWKAFNFNF